MSREYRSASSQANHSLPSTAAAHVEAARAASNTLLALGDSLSGGAYATTQAQGYLYLVAQALGASALIPTLPNVPAPYGTTAVVDAYALSLLTSPLPRARIIIVELGTNDTAETNGMFFGAYNYILSHLRTYEPGVRVLCLGLWRDSSQAPREQWMQATCMAQGVKFVPLIALYNNPAYHGPVGRSTWLGPADYFHPNDAGHAAIAQAIEAVLP